MHAWGGGRNGRGGRLCACLRTAMRHSHHRPVAVCAVLAPHSTRMKACAHALEATLQRRVLRVAPSMEGGRGSAMWVANGASSITK